MPGGNKNINASDGKQFSSDYQPVNRRKSTKLLTDLLKKKLRAKEELIIEGIDVETGKKTSVKVTTPSKQTIIAALLKQAAKGNVNAIREVFDRIEGKPLQQTDIGFDWESMNDETIDLIVSKVLSGSAKK